MNSFKGSKVTAADDPPLIEKKEMKVLYFLTRFLISFDLLPLDVLYYLTRLLVLFTLTKSVYSTRLILFTIH